MLRTWALIAGVPTLAVMFSSLQSGAFKKDCSVLIDGIKEAADRSDSALFFNFGIAIIVAMVVEFLFWPKKKEKNV